MYKLLKLTKFVYKSGPIIKVRLRAKFGKIIVHRQKAGGQKTARWKFSQRFKFVAYFFPPASETRLPVPRHLLLNITEQMQFYVFSRLWTCYVCILNIQ